MKFKYNVDLQRLGTKALCDQALCGLGTVLRLKNGSYVAVIAGDVATLVAAGQQLDPDDFRQLAVSRIRHVLVAPQSHSYRVNKSGKVGGVVNPDPVWPLTTWWELEGADLYEPYD